MEPITTTVVAPPRSADWVIVLLRTLGLRRIGEAIDGPVAPTGRYEILTVGSAEHQRQHPTAPAAGALVVAVDDAVAALARTVEETAELEQALCGAAGITGGAARVRRVAEGLLAWTEVPGALVLRPESVADAAAIASTIHRLAATLGVEVPPELPESVPRRPYHPVVPRHLAATASLTAGDLLDRIGVHGSWWPPTMTAAEAAEIGAIPSSAAGIRRVRARGRGGALSPAEAEIVGHLSLATATVVVPRRSATADAVVFVHIRKAAGTTVDHVLQPFVEEDEVLDAELMRLPPRLWPPSATDGIRYLKAHATADALRSKMPDAHLVTMLRHPIDRLVSHHGHLQWDRTPPEIRATLEQLPDLRHAIELASSLPLGDWIRRQATDGDAYLPDHQTCALAGPEDAFQRHGLAPRNSAADGAAMLERALRILSDEIAFFGIVEDLQRSMRLLEVTFDLPHGIARPEVLNASPSGTPVLDDELRELAEREHQLDLALHIAAVDLFERRCTIAGISPS